MEPKIMEYRLEIYRPHTAEDAWMSFASTAPFMEIAKGDIINPGVWPGSQAPMKGLRAVNIEHDIFEDNVKIWHRVLVFTEEVEDLKEARMLRSFP